MSSFPPSPTNPTQHCSHGTRGHHGPRRHQSEHVLLPLLCHLCCLWLTTFYPLQCDQCRLRKIRCDKESPCSNCRSARRSCSSTGAGQKPKEHRQRVLISSQYERKIDQIEDRLAGIEKLLQQLIANNATGKPVTPVPSQGSRANTQTAHLSAEPPGLSLDRNTPAPATAARDDDASTSVFDAEEAGDEADFEGDSSLRAHTVFASEFLADAVQRTSLHSSGQAKIQAALSSLRAIVDRQKRRETEKKTSSADGIAPRWVPSGLIGEPGPGLALPKRVVRLRDLPLPPQALVIEKLRELRHGPAPIMLAVLYCFTDIRRFIEQCQRIYFNAEDPTDSAFLLVNAGLLYVFFEASLGAKDPSEKARYENCRELCQRNLETVIAQLNLMMPATLENVEALLMGSSFCIDVSRPSLAWLLVSRAAHMCRTLGWHQAQTMKDDTPQVKSEKSLLFWCTYMLDKALSLRLGRASVLQDYDISLPHIGPEAKPSYPGKEVMTLWIKHAQIQGRVYERLYSPGALRQPLAARAEQIRILCVEVNRLLGESTRLYDECRRAGDDDREGQMFAIILKSDEVSYLSSLALACRAMPPTPGGRSRTFSDECIDVARAAMRSHLEAMEMMDDQSLKIVYIHWTLLYAPFIPFIVIFCLVIETLDAGDLQRLADFVRSLAPTCAVSPAAARLYQLCQVLNDVATLYVGAKAPAPNNNPNPNNNNQQAPDDDDTIPLGNEFDMYLSQLGFIMPTTNDGSAQNSAGDGMGVGGGTGAPDIGGAGGGTEAATAGGVGDDYDMMGPGLAAPSSQLGDWFTGNNYMLGLLEEDLSAINPSLNGSTWPSS
ncbi:fungal-specific transcription factor domain protein [Xylariomycetidae sp. FL2044]|nr:fungal-specific transcription factor domain protein [Xylariomycetidae sp. FL2044]